MPIESLTSSLRDSSRPTFLFGSTPPREGTSIERAKESCKKFVMRSAVLAIDGFIVYDIQDEGSRTDLARPFPFRKTIDSSLYASFFPPVSGKQCVVYKCIADESVDDYSNWLNNSCDNYGHIAYNLVGAASSKNGSIGITLPEAAALLNQKTGSAFGCVCIPERHTTKGNETHNMWRKVDLGAQWFITQGIFAAEPVIKLINEYADLCKAKEITPKKVVLTFAPCGRAKTMQFIKWLGMYVPEETEKRILEASNPVQESKTILNELLVDILAKTGGCGVPIGINVESLSIFKEEINGAHELFQSLQAILLNSRGSPWSVRWFDVRRSLRFTAKFASTSSLQELQQLYSSLDDSIEDLNDDIEFNVTRDVQLDSRVDKITATTSPESIENSIDSKAESKLTPSYSSHQSIMSTLVLISVSTIIGFCVGRYSVYSRK